MSAHNGNGCELLKVDESKRKRIVVMMMTADDENIVVMMMTADDENIQSHHLTGIQVLLLNSFPIDCPSM